MTVNANGRGSWFLEALTVLFVALKLTGVIGWSWWWVLAPLWIPAAIVAVLFVCFATFAALVFFIDR